MTSSSDGGFPRLAYSAEAPFHGCGVLRGGIDSKNVENDSTKIQYAENLF